jgi:tRNA pseudouridine55 synthase
MQTPRVRSARRPGHGVVLLDKPLGLSSNDALQKIKWLLQAEKAGHTGTLDPLATGLLPICFGAATKYSQVHLEADKAYRATLKLGVTTSTADAEGAVLKTRPVEFSDADLASVLAKFTGAIAQVPPMHSALKRDGKALYEYAREGIEIERDARNVTIYDIRVTEPYACGSDELVLDVRCSKGTYIRTLAEDIGEALGCGAHLSALRRTGTGGLGLEGAVTLLQLEKMTMPERCDFLKATDSLLLDWPSVTLSEEDAGRFLSGVRRRLSHKDTDHIRVYGSHPNAFLGSASVKAGELIPGRLVSPIEIQQTLSFSPTSLL